MFALARALERGFSAKIGSFKEALTNTTNFAMDNKFENFLRDQHAEMYHGFDDDMPVSFERWLESLDANDLIEYGNQAMNEIKT